MTLLADPAVSYRAKVVYGIMSARTFQVNLCTAGVRQVAEILRIGRSTAARAVKELERGEYLKKRPRKNGQRAVYELTSPVFAQKQGKVDGVQYGPTGKRLVSVERKWSWTPTAGGIEE